MSVFSRLRTLAIANFTPKRGSTHSERLDSYYRHQAAHYDEFREHLLHGRRPLLEQLPIVAGAHIVEFGAGTGWMAGALGERLTLCREYTMVDLCEPLMEQAARRIVRNGWKNVKLVEADAAEFKPSAPVDIVICSYVLTMMPNWVAVLDQAERILRQGGVIGVTDFYVSGRTPEPPMRFHGGVTREFWKACFAWHHVYLNEEHLPDLRRRFQTRYLSEHFGRMPFMAGLRSPYYVFVGEKRLAASSPVAVTDH